MWCPEVDPNLQGPRACPADICVLLHMSLGKCSAGMTQLNIIPGKETPHTDPSAGMWKQHPKHQIDFFLVTEPLNSAEPEGMRAVESVNPSDAEGFLALSVFCDKGAAGRIIFFRSEIRNFHIITCLLFARPLILGALWPTISSVDFDPAK